MNEEPLYFSQQVTEVRRWFLARPDGMNLPLSIVSVGCERCLPQYRVKRPTFDLYCVELVAEGEGTLVMNGRRTELRPGTAFAYGPGVAHSIRNDSDRPMLKYFLDFQGKHGAGLMKECALKIGGAVQVTDIHEVVDLYEILIRNAINESPFQQKFCAGIIEALLAKISEKAIPISSGDARALVTFQRVKRHMDEHYLDIKSIAELALMTHVNAAYLSRLFKRFHHLSPYQHLMRLKMSRAASLLLSPGILVKEVADKMRFGDPFHFSRAFKSVYGMSPERFIHRGSRARGR